MLAIPQLVVVARPCPKWHQEKPEGVKHRVLAPWASGGWEGLSEEGLCGGEISRSGKRNWRVKVQRRKAECWRVRVSGRGVPRAGLMTDSTQGQ